MLPKSGAVREDHHADTTQIHRHDAGRRRSAHHKRTTGAAAARKQAHDRRRPGAFLESKFAGLAWEPGVRPQLPEPFTIERALPMMDEAGVDRVVIVPPGLNDRNDYALEAAKRYPNRFGGMGRVRLGEPKTAGPRPRWGAQRGRARRRVRLQQP